MNDLLHARAVGAIVSGVHLPLTATHITLQAKNKVFRLETVDSAMCAVVCAPPAGFDWRFVMGLPVLIVGGGLSECWPIAVAVDEHKPARITIAATDWAGILKDGTVEERWAK